jgi:D-galactarolactone cycloisomerase
MRQHIPQVLLQAIAAYDTSICINSARAHVIRVPIDTPVRTSFGVMHDRPAVFVEVEDIAGQVGWGEVWCNFPAVGAEHRARLLESVVRSALCGVTFSSPSHAWHALCSATHILSLQSGEPGPIAQVLAGTETALWDLVARRAQLPLWKMLGGDGRVSVYASGISLEHAETVIEQKWAQGYRAFKLKVGFDHVSDMKMLSKIRHQYPTHHIMLDANQAWTHAQAAARVADFEAFSPRWIEEPLPADAPLANWLSLKAQIHTPLAGGENVRGLDNFRALSGSAFEVVQPDIGKWGGFTGVLSVAELAAQNGAAFCPHWLGAGIGLAASLVALDVCGERRGVCEVDANPNPLRDALTPWQGHVVDGYVTLNNTPGYCVPPELAALSVAGNSTHAKAHVFEPRRKAG